MALPFNHQVVVNRIRGHQIDIAERGVQRTTMAVATAAAGTAVYNAFYGPSTTFETSTTSETFDLPKLEGFERDVILPGMGQTPIPEMQAESLEGFEEDVIMPAMGQTPASSGPSSSSPTASSIFSSEGEPLPPGWNLLGMRAHQALRDIVGEMPLLDIDLDILQTAIDPNIFQEIARAQLSLREGSFVTPAEFQRRQVMPSQEYDSYLERVQSHTASILTRPIINPSLMAIKNGGLLQPSHQPILYRRDGTVGHGNKPMLTNATGGQSSSVQGREGGQREQYGYLPDYRISHTVGDIGIQ